MAQARLTYELVVKEMGSYIGVGVRWVGPTSATNRVQPWSEVCMSYDLCGNRASKGRPWIINQGML